MFLIGMSLVVLLSDSGTFALELVHESDGFDQAQEALVVSARAQLLDRVGELSPIPASRPNH